MKSICTSSSVLGFRYKDGIIVASDTSLNYGNLKIQTNVEKHFILSNDSLFIIRGEYSDFQELKKYCEDEMEIDYKMGIKEWIRFIQRILYYRRSEMRPLNLGIIVAGIDYTNSNISKNGINSIEIFDSKYILGVIDKQGNFFTDDAVSQGMASFLSIPFVREHDVKNFERNDAIELMRINMNNLFMRDCMAHNQVKIFGVDKKGIWTKEIKLDGNWEIGKDI